MAAFRRSDALPWLGKSRGGLRRSSEWLGAVLRIGEYLPTRRGTASAFGRAWEHLILLAAVAAWRCSELAGNPGGLAGTQQDPGESSRARRRTRGVQVRGVAGGVAGSGR